MPSGVKFQVLDCMSCKILNFWREIYFPNSEGRDVIPCDLFAKIDFLA